MGFEFVNGGLINVKFVIEFFDEQTETMNKSNFALNSARMSIKHIEEQPQQKQQQLNFK